MFENAVPEIPEVRAGYMEVHYVISSDLVISLISTDCPYTPNPDRQWSGFIRKRYRYIFLKSEYFPFEHDKATWKKVTRRMDIIGPSEYLDILERDIGDVVIALREFTQSDPIATQKSIDLAVANCQWQPEDLKEMDEFFAKQKQKDIEEGLWP